MALTDPDMDVEEELDALGLLCPLPVLKAAKRMRGLTPGQRLRIKTDDPAAIVDIPHFCTEQGYTLISSADEGAFQVHIIEKA